MTNHWNDRAQAQMIVTRLCDADYRNCNTNAQAIVRAMTIEQIEQIGSFAYGD